ncbi:MAG: amidohydrolase family protein [Synergistaceae bacterium]|jgi:cytosine/adenosine deaminase-related metal-dependent hydrolase|nr:amidohydrolase family protein [Synergistaceae bacterium]
MKGKTTLIHNASFVIGCENDEHYIMPDGEVAYRDDTILFVGKKYGGQADEKIDAKRAIVSPGFLNLHVHLQGACLERNILPDTGSPFHYMSGLFRMARPLQVAPEDERAMFELAIAELMSKGTTTVFHQGYGLDDVVKTLGESGLRVVYGHGASTTRFTSQDGKSVTYAPKPKGKDFEDLHAAMELRAKYDGAFDGRMTIAMSLNQADTCSPELLDEAAGILRSDGDLICCIHAAQSIVEYLHITQTYGVTPAHFLHDHGICGPNVHYGHYFMPSGHSMNTMKLEGELELIADDGTHVMHCPLSFGRRGMLLESFQKYHDMGINMGIGTDTMPLDIVMEMRYAAVFCKIAEGGNPLKGTAATVFNAATTDGARALHRSDLGRLEPGCKADIVLIDTLNTDCTPVRDPIKTIVYSASGSDVSSVIVNGERIVRDGLPVNIDLEKIVNKAQEGYDRALELYPRAHCAGLTHWQFSPMSFPLRD